MTENIVENNDITNRSFFINTIENVFFNHGLDFDTLTPELLTSMLINFEREYNYVKQYYIKNELDSFKVASCLMVTINKALNIENEVERAQIAADVAYVFIQKPFCNIGTNYNELIPLEEVDFEEVFLEEQQAFEVTNNEIIRRLVTEGGTPINYFNKLESLYKVAINIKHRYDTIEKDETVIKESGLFKVLRLFKRKKEGVLE